MEEKHASHNRRYRQDVKLNMYVLLKYMLAVYVGRLNAQRSKSEFPGCRKEYSFKNQPKNPFVF